MRIDTEHLTATLADLVRMAERLGLGPDEH